MKRDPDLIRNILIAVENSENRLNDGHISFDGFSQDQINYHVLLLHEAGYINAIIFDEPDGIHGFLISRLTWQGHDFIEAARNESAWKKAKGIMEGTGSFVLELTKPLLLQLIRQQLGLPDA